MKARLSEVEAQRKILETVEDLHARLITEEKALEQTRHNMQQIQIEKEALHSQLDHACRKQTAETQKKLSELDKRYRFQCELEDRHQSQIDQVKAKQKQIDENFASVIHTYPSGCAPESAAFQCGGKMADTIFTIVHNIDQQRIAEHAAVRSAVPIRRLVKVATRLPQKSKERFSKYVQLHGVAQANADITAPVSDQKAACYETTVNLILEDGTETIVWHKAAFDALCIQDPHTEDALIVDADGYGSRLRMDTVVYTVLSASELPPSLLNKFELPSRILNYHIIEYAILPGSPLFIEGEVYIDGDTLHVRRVFDRAHTPIVTTQSEKELKKPRSQRAVVSVIVGAVFLAFAIIIVVSNLIKH